MNSLHGKNKQNELDIGNMETKLSEENVSDPGNHSLIVLKYFH